MAAAALFGLIGAIVGGAFGGESGAFLGFSVGVGAALLRSLSTRFGRLESEIADLRMRVRSLESRTPPAEAAAGPKASTTPATPVHERLPVTPPPVVREPVPAPPVSQQRPDKPPAHPPAIKPPQLPQLPQSQPVTDEAWAAGMRWVVEFFTTGNVVAKVGVVILFFGAAFLVRYAADRGLLPIEYRLIGLVLTSLALLAVGWRLRQTRRAYAMALQGGAVGLLYLTVFAAFRVYDLVPAFLAFALLLAIVIFSVALAVIQDAKSLAVLGASGGFLAPILASTGSGNHVGLFSYYLILNAGIVVVAWFRAWRILNWIGFVFTFGIGFVWGAQYFQPEIFRSTEPFLVLFFAFYLLVAVLFGLRQPPRLRGYVDGSLVFGLPAIAFSMQSVLVREIPFGRAYSAVALSALYLVLARVLRPRRELRMLTEAFLALGMVFLILAVPLAFDGHGTAAAWALEGAGLVWIGVRQQRVLARCVGSLLLIGAGVAFEAVATTSASAVPILNSRFLGSVAIAIGGLVASRQYATADRVLREWEPPIEWGLLAWGLMWWAGATGAEIGRFVPGPFQPSSVLLVLAASALIAAVVARRLSWLSLMHATMAALPLVWAVALASFVDAPEAGPLVDLGWIAWPAALATSFVVLRFFEDVWPASLARVGHVGTAWLFTFLMTWAVATAVARVVPDTPTWGQVAWAIVPSILLVAFVRHGDRLTWPVRRHEALYGGIVPLGPLAFLVIWVLWACTQEGKPAPLPYLPMLNPIEIAQAFAIVAASAWLIRSRRATYLPDSLVPYPLATLGTISFVALNAVVARIVHVYLGAPFTVGSLAGSASFQAGISVLWALTALTLMALASRRALRPIWITGAGLLAVLVVKLFVADLSQVGAIGRVVSFLVTGLLILVIGYVAPVPPKAQEVQS
jgi:uncharacterized membrane protein